MKKDILEIEKRNAIQAYKAADKKGKELLSTLFKDIKLEEDLIDILNNFDDVLTHNNIFSYDWNNMTRLLTKRQIGFLKVDIIISTFNEGWEPDFDDRNQAKYYVWFEKRSSGWSVYDVFYPDVLSCLPAGFYFKDRSLALCVTNKFLAEFSQSLNYK